MVYKLNIVIYMMGLILFLTQCNHRSVSQSKPTTVAIEDSKEIADHDEPKLTYEKFCAGCHGHQMKAFVDRKWIQGSSKEDLSRSIRDGMVDDGMPAYGKALNEQEIVDLVDYILTGIEDRKSYDPVLKSTPKYYNTDIYALVVDTMVTGLEIPWSLKVTEDGRIFFTERKGTLKLRKRTGEVVTIKNVPKVRNRGQGGMMDVVLHPDFESNQVLFLSYSKPMNKGQTTAVVRARVVADALTELEEIFVALPAVPTKYHFGSRMVFDNQGYLYITVGDRGRRDVHPQSLNNSCGKVHRIYEDGSIPEDNPFVEVPGAVTSIWSYGHRNPQGMVYNPVSDELWTHEHGPRGGDELNQIKPKINYGWPVISYGLNYDGTTFTTRVKAPEMEQPAQIWTPSIAPCGMAMVVGDNYDQWNGDILSGSLRFDYISRISTENGIVVNEERILNDIGRVRAIEMGMDGFLYVAVEDDGRILRVTVK